MRFFTLFLLVLSISFTQAATLTASKGIKILAIDGKEINSGFLSKEDPKISDGTHQVVVRYINNFRNGDTVESKPHIFDLTVSDDTKISVKKYNNQYQAEKAIKKGLVWLIITHSGTQKIVKSDTLTGKGFMPYSDIEKLITDYNQQNGIKTTLPVAVTTTVALTTNEITVENKTEQLIELYTTANKAERKAFRLWLIEQDMQ